MYILYVPTYYKSYYLEWVWATPHFDTVQVAVYFCFLYFKSPKPVCYQAGKNELIKRKWYSLLLPRGNNVVQIIVCSDMLFNVWTALVNSPSIQGAKTQSIRQFLGSISSSVCRMNIDRLRPAIQEEKTTDDGA